MTLYGRYVTEREGSSIVENDYGFATYRFQGEDCFILDIYVIPEQRKNGIASQLADQIAELAKEQGCKFLMGSVCPSANGSTESLKVLLAYGFKLHSSVSNFIILKKSLE